MKYFIEILKIFLQRNDKMLFFSQNNEGHSPYYYLISTVHTFLRENNATTTSSPQNQQQNNNNNQHANLQEMIIYVREIDTILKKHVQEYSYVVKY
eukprot:UN03942